MWLEWKFKIFFPFQQMCFNTYKDRIEKQKNRNLYLLYFASFGKIQRPLIFFCAQTCWRACVRQSSVTGPWIRPCSPPSVTLWTASSPREVWSPLAATPLWLLVHPTPYRCRPSPPTSLRPSPASLTPRPSPTLPLLPPPVEHSCLGGLCTCRDTDRRKRTPVRQAHPIFSSAMHRNCKQSFIFNRHAPTTMSSCFSASAGMPPQSMAPRQRPPLKNLHSNSEEIQDDFDWDSLLI